MHKILVVDDEQDICGFLKSFLEERGYEVLVAHDGETALSIVKGELISAVLLDIRMKGMDGIAVLRHMKEYDRGIKVVMITAMEDQDKMDEACRLGAHDYVTKPLELDRLEDIIGKLVK